MEFLTTNLLSTTLQVVSRLVQPASQSTIELACISSGFLSIHSFSVKSHYSIHPFSLTSIIVLTPRPSDPQFHYLCILYSSSHPFPHLAIQPPQPFSSTNLTMPFISFSHSNNEHVVPISFPSSPWQTHLLPPNPPSKLQQLWCNWERTSM